MAFLRINASTIHDDALPPSSHRVTACRRLWAERGRFQSRRHFGGGGKSSAPAPVAPPREDDPAVQQAASEAARRRKTARGYRSTILSDLYQRGTTLGGAGAEGGAGGGQGSTFGT
jgi:hypothetical protein